MAKLKSTVPGLIYPPGRDSFMKTGFAFLEGRKKNDGAEGLWRIKDNLYDLEPFVKNHPGGSEWISITKGTDITEAFEVHHVFENAEKLLPKFFVRQAESPRNAVYTFEPNGFYRKLKERVREALKNVDTHNSSAKSKKIADSLMAMTILLAIAVAIYKSWIVIIFAALFLSWTVISAHNFFHLKDNFRMYYFDMSMMSSKEWRISHVLSHHMYPNTIWDMEIYSFEPFLEYLPKNDKSRLFGLITIITTPIIFCSIFLYQAVKRPTFLALSAFSVIIGSWSNDVIFQYQALEYRKSIAALFMHLYYSMYVEWKIVEFRDIVPFFLPILMSFFCSSSWEAVRLWFLIIALASLIFSFVGLTAAHHHPKIFHDGDTCREDLDWGLMEVDAARERKIIDDSLFLALTNFGFHTLHHLFPTLDHALLEHCWLAYYKTCQEFGIDCDRFSQWELIKGQYQQLMRFKPRFNARIKK